MKLKIDQWHSFTTSSILTIQNGRGITIDEIAENPGYLNAVQSGEERNGVLGQISENYCREMGYTFTTEKCLTVARTGTAGYVSFQADGCVVGDSAKLLLLQVDDASTEVYLFIQTILNQNRFKYSYGRKVTEEKYMRDIIDLPIQRNSGGAPILDPSKTYSSEGYVPDWQFMGNFVRSLHHLPISTGNSKTNSGFRANEWEFFLLNRLCSIDMGNKMDFSAMTAEEPTINFVGRSADNNGVVGKVDRVDGAAIYPAGAVTIALGGSLGATFIQDEPFYTSQNVAVLKFDTDAVSIPARLFLASMIEFESRFKYSPFGRELNKYIRTIYGFVLPIRRNQVGEPVIDPNKEYHEQGFVPDWEFMRDYIRSLPYGDRIPELEK